MITLVKQCFEWKQVEFTIRRDQQLCGVANQRAKRLHHFLINSTSELFDIFPLRVGQRVTQRLKTFIDHLGFAQLFPQDVSLTENISDISGLAKGLLIIGSSWIKWPINS